MAYDDTHFVVTPELLKLLKWLIEHEQDLLNKVIAKALKNGLDKEMAQSNADNISSDHLQHYIVDFLSLLEMLVYENRTEQQDTSALHRALIPAIKYIDGSQHDPSAMEVSIAKAAHALQVNRKANGKEVLCKELLRRWRPTAKKNCQQ